MNFSFELKNINFKIDEKIILKDVSLSLREGELGAIIGPSGSGKTTLLKLISGLEKTTSGEIFLGDKNITLLPARKRNIGLIFQDYALFSHLNAFENILLGLELKEIDQSFFDKLTTMLKLQGLLNRYPHELSGGQQQRVAIFRSLIRKPKLILLDEPFSGLDSNLKESMAKELRKLFKELKINALLITHDQKEAFNFSDSIGVLIHSKLQQWSDPTILYQIPSTREVASFIGGTKFLSAKIYNNKVETELGSFSLTIDSPNIEQAELMIRPHQIKLLNDSEIEFFKKLGKKYFQAIVEETHFHGDHFLYYLKIPNGEIIKASSFNSKKLEENSLVYFALEIDQVVIFP